MHKMVPKTLHHVQFLESNDLLRYNIHDPAVISSVRQDEELGNSDSHD